MKTTFGSDAFSKQYTHPIRSSDFNFGVDVAVSPVNPPLTDLDGKKANDQFVQTTFGLRF